MNTLKRQGDILLERVEKEGAVTARPIPDGIIERGEATGHAHKLEGGTLVQGGGSMFAMVPEGGRVTHQEHETLELEPGVWLVHRQSEYVGPDEMQTVYD